jgi:hypothetical protein
MSSETRAMKIARYFVAEWRFPCLRKLAKRRCDSAGFFLWIDQYLIVLHIVQMTMADKYNEVYVKWDQSDEDCKIRCCWMKVSLFEKVGKKKVRLCPIFSMDRPVSDCFAYCSDDEGRQVLSSLCQVRPERWRLQDTLLLNEGFLVWESWQKEGETLPDFFYG